MHWLITKFIPEFLNSIIQLNHNKYMKSFAVFYANNQNQNNCFNIIF